MGRFGRTIRASRFRNEESGWRTAWFTICGPAHTTWTTVLNQATTIADLNRWLNGDTLRRLWPSLWLPAPLVALRQARFPELATPPQGMAG